MTTRRPRLKALANLSVKRPVKLSDESNDVKVEQKSNVSNAEEPVTLKVENISIKNDEKTENKTSSRRRIKATVNIPASRKVKPAPIIVKPLEPPQSPQSPFNNAINSIDSPNNADNLDEHPPKSPFNDSLFKSPRNVPQMRTVPAATKTIPKENSTGMSPGPVSMSPIGAGSSALDIDSYESIKSPMSPTKVRQRIRPTPIFGIRRNSMQGNSSDVEDEPRRQRHHSTSSSSSNQNQTIGNGQGLGIIGAGGGGVGGSSRPNYGYQNHTRVRYDSTCSNASDISVVKEILANKNQSQPQPQQSRRGIRSEESYRMVEARREFRHRFSGQPPDKTQLTMYDMIYYNPLTNPMKNPAIKSELLEKDKERRMSLCGGSSVSSFSTKREIRTPTAQSVKDEDTDSMPVPQLKLGPNGEMMIDEKSLLIETTGEKEARETLANADIVYDDEFSGSQGFYRRQQRTRDWRPEETIKFYRCLHTLGTDFSMMLSLFPNRSRRDLKLKFKKEEKLNSALINKALMHPKLFNIDELKTELEDDEKEEEKRKAEEKEVTETLKMNRIADRK